MPVPSTMIGLSATRVGILSVLVRSVTMRIMKVQPMATHWSTRSRAATCSITSCTPPRTPRLPSLVATISSSHTPRSCSSM